MFKGGLAIVFPVHESFSYFAFLCPGRDPGPTQVW